MINWGILWITGVSSSLSFLPSIHRSFCTNSCHITLGPVVGGDISSSSTVPPLQSENIWYLPISIVFLMESVSAADAACHIPLFHRPPIHPTSPIIVISPLQYYSPSSITFPIAASKMWRREPQLNPPDWSRPKGIEIHCLSYSLAYAPHSLQNTTQLVHFYACGRLYPRVVFIGRWLSQCTRLATYGAMLRFQLCSALRFIPSLNSQALAPSLGSHLSPLPSWSESTFFL